jgi:hypothetical protein
MSFNIQVNGDVVHEVEIDSRLVVQVKVLTAAGEAGVAGVPFSGEGSNWVNLVLVTQQPTALPVKEDDARLKAQEEGPEEVLTYNPVAQKAEEEQELNPDGSAAQETEEATSEEEASPEEESSNIDVEPMS